MAAMALKPHLVRADTIDLQSHENPSAKDHTRQPMHSAQYGYNHIGPHHNQALRHANQDAYREQQTSPLLADFDHTRLTPQNQHSMYDDGDDDEDEEEEEGDEQHAHNGQNGSLHHDGEYGEDEGNDSHDDDMDDDLMDKISSSPSIDDGKSHWPARDEAPERVSSCFPPTRGCSPCSLLPHVSVPEQNIVLPASSGHHPSQTEAAPYPSPLTLSHIDDQREFSTRPTHTAKHKSFLNGLIFSPSVEDISRHFVQPEDDTLSGECDISEDDHSEELFNDQDLDSTADTTYRDPWSSSDDDYDHDHDQPALNSEPRFLDSGWGGECLREVEDIDFDFVYALHTFVATVEGQANATKGDTMVLLDDSNSYWWLVRVVKDGSIGYLPAEHIETPTERLARLNKHRNIDLSAAMLGDNHEKSKNPLKKAMRRRNAKSVNFAPPTYYEPQEPDWSDEEEGEEGDGGDGDGDVAQNAENDEAQAQQTQTAQQPDSVDGPQASSHINTKTITRVRSDEDLDAEPMSPIGTDVTPAPLQLSSQDAVNRSRKGTVRNTDSFFKDDTVETKKISLTPRLLRGDSEASTPVEPQLQQPQQADIRQRPSLEALEKSSSEEKSKDGGKKKEKKGMLSGLFKRKDKAPKPSKNDAGEESERASEDSGRSPLSKDSMESADGPERRPSKLQKAPPTGISPKNSPTEVRAPQPNLTTPQTRLQAPSAPVGPAPAPPSTTSLDPTVANKEGLTVDSHQAPGRFPSLNEKRSVFSPITTVLRSKTSNPDVGDGASKPIYSKRAKERFAIDESDSEDDTSTPTAHSSLLHRSISPLQHNEAQERLAKDVQPVSPIEAQLENTAPTAAAAGNYEVLNTPQTHRAATTEMGDALNTQGAMPSPSTATTQSKPSPSATSMHTPSTSRSTPTWSDASLRTYMDRDSNQDIRDLLVIVHDRSNVTPVSNDHPLMAGLYADERSRLADMQSQLDGMLIGWLGKRGLMAKAGG